MCDNSEMVSCEICGRDFGDLNKLSKHFRVHKISSKDYYDKYLKKDDEDICNRSVCFEITKFCSLKEGYLKYLLVISMRQMFQHILIKLQITLKEVQL